MSTLTELPEGVRRPVRAVYVERLNREAERAAEAVLEAAYAWLVVHDLADAGEHYGERVWALLDEHYPGGATAFRADPVRATFTAPDPDGRR